MTIRGPELEELTRRWLAGWCRSRDLVLLERRPGWVVHVADVHRETELVLADPDDSELAAAFAAVTGDPRSRLTVVGEVVMPRGHGLRSHTPDEQLMTTTLRAHGSRAVPDGLVLHRDVGAAHVRLSLVVGDREVAGGQVGLGGGDAVVDQVEVARSHRRQGLGRWVVAALTREALDAGTTTGLLVATPEGHELYRALGWSARAPVEGWLGA